MDQATIAGAVTAAFSPGDKKNQAAPESAPGSGRDSRKANSSKPPVKKLRMIQLLLERGEKGLNRFEAAAHHDTVFNSTVAAIQRDGIRVDRNLETIPGFAGSSVTCCRYKLVNTEARRRAAELLGLEA